MTCQDLSSSANLSHHHPLENLLAKEAEVWTWDHLCATPMLYLLAMALGLNLPNLLTDSEALGVWVVVFFKLLNYTNSFFW